MTSIRGTVGRLLLLLCIFGSAVLASVPASPVPSQADGIGFIAYTTNRIADQFELFRVRADGAEERRLTVNLFADEIDPDWSPDGSRIALVSNQFGSPDIFIMNSDGTDQQRLIVNAFRRELDPSWSPDGMSIAFAWDLEGGQFDIWVADLRAGIARQVTNDSSSNARYPSWSPDGRQLAYTCRRAGQDEICVVDLKTLHVRRLTERSFTDDRQPAWSPDGAHILFTSAGVIQSLQGERSSMLTAGWSLSAPATDTATVVFTATPTDTATVTPSSTSTNTASPMPTETGTATSTLTSTATGTPTGTATYTLTPTTDKATSTATSPPDTPTRTATATPTASSTVTPTRTSTPSSTATATKTPSRTSTITATPTVTPVPIEGSAIWIMNADGSNPHPLIDPGHRVYDPAWSPDGMHVVFTRQHIDLANGHLGVPEIYLYDLATGSVSPLGSSQAPVRGQAPDWIGAITTARSTPTPTREMSPPPPPPPPPPATPTPTSTPGVPPPPPPPATPTSTKTTLPPPPPGATSTATNTAPPPPPATSTATQTPLPPSATSTPTRTPTPIVNVTPTPPSGTTCQVIQNPSFETGPPADPWMLERKEGTGTLIRTEARRNGVWGLRMGASNSAWDEARQVISLTCPALDDVADGSRIVAELSFWTRVTTTGPATNGDVLNVVLLTSDGRQLLRLLKTLTDQDADGQWHQTTILVSDYVGQTVQVAIGATTDEEYATTFDLDDVELWLRAERAQYRRYLPLLSYSAHQ